MFSFSRNPSKRFAAMLTPITIRSITATLWMMKKVYNRWFYLYFTL